MNCAFVNFDDPEYVTSNLDIRHLDLNLISAAFAHSYAGFWMPLTLISFAVDYAFWGLNPVGFHLTNLLLHGLNTALVTLITHRLVTALKAPARTEVPLWLLASAGLLFGIHPLRAESVVWVTERKDVLNGCFALGSVFFYLCYAIREKEASHARRRAYLLSLGLFTASLMAKSVSVVLPLLLLILDWYPLKRFATEKPSALIREKLPFFAFSAVMATVTLAIAKQEAFLIPADAFPLWSRATVSGNAIFEYLRLILLPFGIVPVYKLSFPIPASYLWKTILVIVIACACLTKARKRPGITAAFGCFLLPLIPTLAFFQNSTLSHAARFTYLPSVAIAIALSLLLHTQLPTAMQGKRLFSSPLLAVPAIALLITYGALSVYQTFGWRDSNSMWTRVIEHQHFPKAYWFRGTARMETGDFKGAIADFSAAITSTAAEDRPDLFNHYAYRGMAHMKSGQYQQAVDDFSSAISMFPHPSYYRQRALAYQASGRPGLAQADRQAAGNAQGEINWLAGEN